MFPRVAGRHSGSGGSYSIPEVRVFNRKVVAAVALTFALSLTFARGAEARHRRRGCSSGGSALAALAVGGLIGSSFNNGYYGGGYGGGYGGYGYGGGYGGGYYDPYAQPVVYQPVGYGAYSPYGYGGYSPYGGGYGGGYGAYPGYYGRRSRSNILPALIGAGIVYSILRNR